MTNERRKKLRQNFNKHKDINVETVKIFNADVSSIKKVVKEMEINLYKVTVNNIRKTSADTYDCTFHGIKPIELCFE